LIELCQNIVGSGFLDTVYKQENYKQTLNNFKRRQDCIDSIGIDDHKVVHKKVKFLGHYHHHKPWDVLQFVMVQVL